MPTSFRSMLKNSLSSPNRRRSRRPIRAAALEKLEDRALLAAQFLSSDATTRTVSPGDTIDVPVIYQTLDDAGNPSDLRANVLGMNLHFDDSQLTYVETTAFFQEGIQVVPNLARSESEVSGDDNDANTESVLVSSYSDTDIAVALGWPNDITADGITLFIARFTVNQGFTGTNINFSANATGNVIGQSAQFDFESESLTLNATPPNSSPTITSGNAASVTENQTDAINVDATDADNDTLTFSIGGTDASLFSIDSSTGAVTFNNAPDFEAPADDGNDNIYNFTVTVDDGNGGSDSQDIAITVTDVAENVPPTITSPNSASVAENQTAAIDVDATDANNDSLTFSISGTDSSLFGIDAATGVVTFNNAPDFEEPGDDGADNIYNFTVIVNDGNGGSDQQDVAITVTDENDTAANTPPSIDSPDNNSVDENQTAAITVVASDADNDTLTFSLSGTDASLFSIDDNGVVTFDAAPDFEAPGDADANNVYEFTASVSDGAATANQNIQITVTDVSETANNDPVISSANSASVEENQTSAITVAATDLDNDPLTFALSGDDASLFSVDGNGVITFNDAPDFEGPADAGADNTYNVTVTVDDGNGGTATQNISINVTDVADETSTTFNGSGNVRVRVVANRSLVIVGDNASNGVTLGLNSDGFVTIEGLGATTINGAATPFVIDGWTSIPRNVLASMRSGDDAIVVDGVSVGGNLTAFGGRGNDFFIAQDSSVGRNMSYVDFWGDNTAKISNSTIGRTTRVVTGRGNDMVDADNATMSGRTVIATHRGNDVVAAQESTFSGTTIVHTGSGDDQVASTGSSTFGNRTILLGGGGSDSIDVATTNVLAAPARIRLFEQTSITDVDGLLDSIMQRLAAAGLDNI